MNGDYVQTDARKARISSLRLCARYLRRKYHRALEIHGERKWARDVPHTIDAIVATWDDQFAFEAAKNAAVRSIYNGRARGSRAYLGGTLKLMPLKTDEVSEVCRQTVKAVAEILSRPANVEPIRKSRGRG
jgi:hypothetical protein